MIRAPPGATSGAPRPTQNRRSAPLRGEGGWRRSGATWSEGASGASCSALYNRLPCAEQAAQGRVAAWRRGHRARLRAPAAMERQGCPRCGQIGGCRESRPDLWASHRIPTSPRPQGGSTKSPRTKRHSLAHGGTAASMVSLALASIYAGSARLTILELPVARRLQTFSVMAAKYAAMIAAADAAAAQAAQAQPGTGSRQASAAAAAQARRAKARVACAASLLRWIYSMAGSTPAGILTSPPAPPAASTPPAARRRPPEQRLAARPRTGALDLLPDEGRASPHPPRGSPRR